MNLFDLHAGSTIPNYKKLCELLQESIKDGNGKKAQLKEWERFFSWERDGNAYRITEVFNVPKIINDGRTRCLQYIEPLLMQHLSLHGNFDEVTYSKWGTLLGMLPEYSFNSNYMEQLIQDNGYSQFSLSSLAIVMQECSRRYIDSAIARMEKRDQIAHEINRYIVMEDGKQHIASVGENQLYQDIQQQIMHEFNANKMYSIIINPKKKERYYDELTKAINTHGWKSTYELLHIEANPNAAIENYAEVNTDQVKGNLRAVFKEQVLRILFKKPSITDNFDNAWGAPNPIKYVTHDKMMIEIQELLEIIEN